MSEATFDRTTLGNEAHRLLEALLTYVGEDGRAQVGTAALQEASGLTQGGLVRARNELTQHRLLCTETGYSANGLRGANVYILSLLVLGSASTEVPEGESGQNGTGDPLSELAPALTSVLEASSESASPRRGFLDRVFRRR